ncbi:DUF1028 domain-containing protein [Halopenitus sp. H-Gu1]|uniref:DUF1028 domain-containing protein n=1 Tax=Halopenitus sp. H-Gu1 TaxID=3242697 RepID=UPI00359EA822
MTFSVCVREAFSDEAGERYRRFGVAVTTPLPGVGRLCPFASEDAAIAVQSHVDAELGERAMKYLADGLLIDDAIGGLLRADEARDRRQVHGVGTDGSFAFTGSDCPEWSGHREGENVTVAGTHLAGPAVIERALRAYESSAHSSEPLASRLIDALAAGREAGGDSRTDLSVGSAALIVASTCEHDPVTPYYDDLRVDATETPIDDLRETYENAERGYEEVLARYAAK